MTQDMKSLQQQCEDKIILIIKQYLLNRKQIIGKWVVTLTEWIRLLQVKENKIFYKTSSLYNCLMIAVVWDWAVVIIITSHLTGVITSVRSLITDWGQGQRHPPLPHHLLPAPGTQEDRHPRVSGAGRELETVSAGDDQVWWCRGEDWELGVWVLQ